MKVFDLPTPALIADADVIDGNMAAMAAILRGKPVRLRPHYKSHKCAALAHRQVAAGAVGMTCAKLSEAEDLVFSGVDDGENAKALSRAAAAVGSVVHCLVEYDIGMNRCGVRTPEAYLAVASTVAGLPNLRYEGIQAYAGYASHMVNAEERAAATRENERRVAELAAYLRGHGLAVSTVSGGSTGTSALKAGGGVYTELQAGSYLFMDSTYDRLDVPFRQSLFVLATVVSRHDGAVILDVGVKGLGADQDDPVVLDRDGRRIPGRYVLNEEHLKLYDSGWDAAIGEKALVIPGHCCSTVNLYDRIYLFRGDKVAERLEVTARGRSQ